MSETVERWLTFAREDLRVAEVVLAEGLPGESEAKEALGLAQILMTRVDADL